MRWNPLFIIKEGVHVTDVGSSGTYSKGKMGNLGFCKAAYIKKSSFEWN